MYIKDDGKWQSKAATENHQNFQSDLFMRINQTLYLYQTIDSLLVDWKLTFLSFSLHGLFVLKYAG